MPTAFRFSTADLLQMLAENTDPVELGGALIVDGAATILGNQTVLGGYTTVVFVSPEVDLLAAAPADYPIIPPLPGLRLYRNNTAWLLTQKSGVLLTNPTAAVGHVAPNFNDIFTATADALITLPVDSILSKGGVVVPVSAPFLTAVGVNLRVTIAGTGNPGAVLKARMVMLSTLLPF